MWERVNLHTQATSRRGSAQQILVIQIGSCTSDLADGISELPKVDDKADIHVIHNSTLTSSFCNKVSWGTQKSAHIKQIPRLCSCYMSDAVTRPLVTLHLSEQPSFSSSTLNMFADYNLENAAAGMNATRTSSQTRHLQEYVRYPQGSGPLRTQTDL